MSELNVMAKSHQTFISHWHMANLHTIVQYLPVRANYINLHTYSTTLKCSLINKTSISTSVICWMFDNQKITCYFFSRYFNVYSNVSLGDSSPHKQRMFKKLNFQAHWANPTRFQSRFSHSENSLNCTLSYSLYR